ncbi:MAG: glycine cleavage system protein GcvH [Lentisphaerae bacterium]|nr:glycine cleavage system protein GcvH [Lentisphaerota bacterium]
MTPNDRRYTKTHEWVKLEDGKAVVGITDHAQEALGDITFVDLPKLGRTLAAGGEFGVIESVKAASDLYAPVGGVVSAVNQALNDTPELINRDPYGDGWIITLSGVDAAALTTLLDAADYESKITVRN